jgi:hypothetical protein
MDCFTLQSAIEVRELDNERKVQEVTNFEPVLETIHRIYVYQITYQIRY